MSGENEDGDLHPVNLAMIRSAKEVDRLALARLDSELTTIASLEGSAAALPPSEPEPTTMAEAFERTMRHLAELTPPAPRPGPVLTLVQTDKIDG